MATNRALGTDLAMHVTGDIQGLVQAPSEALRPFVTRFLVVESTAAHCDAHLPDTGWSRRSASGAIAG